MRDPDMRNKVIDDGRDYDIITIDHLPEYNIEDYDLFDEKEVSKFIKDVKKECRQSFEYRQMVKYLKEYMDMNKCSFYENVNNIDSNKIKIEIHHDPLTLEDICKIVYNKRVKYNDLLTVEQTAKEVMYLHYMMKIGLIPLAETVHELVHNQYLFIPSDAVLGHYKDFINMYEQFMEPDQLYILDNILEATKNYRADDLQVLNRKYVYVDITGAYDIPPLEYVKNLMKDKMNFDTNSIDMYEFANNKTPLIIPITIDNNKK